MGKDKGRIPGNREVNQEERSPKIRALLDEKPNRILRYGTAVTFLLFAVLFLILLFAGVIPRRG